VATLACPAPRTATPAPPCLPSGPPDAVELEGDTVLLSRGDACVAVPPPGQRLTACPRVPRVSKALRPLPLPWKPLPLLRFATVKDDRVELGAGRWVPHEPRLRPGFVRRDPPTLVWSSPDGRRVVLWWTSFPSPESLQWLHRFDLVDPVAHRTLASDEGWAGFDWPQDDGQVATEGTVLVLDFVWATARWDVVIDLARDAFAHVSQPPHVVGDAFGQRARSFVERRQVGFFFRDPGLFLATAFEGVVDTTAGTQRSEAPLALTERGLAFELGPARFLVVEPRSDGTCVHDAGGTLVARCLPTCR